MKTLLEVVQEVLSEVDGDTVNTISDTEESEQVARHVVAVYRNMVSNSNWHSHRRALTLVPRSDNLFPTHILLEDRVKELLFINYDTRKVGTTRKNFVALDWKEPDDFLRYVNKRDSTASNIQTVVDDSGIDLLIQNDKAPQYYTTFDDTNIIFDSFDYTVDDTIQESKIQAAGYILPTLSLTDSAVPDLPPDAEAGFIEECIARVQYKMRQFQDVKAEAESTRQKRWLARKNWRTNGGIKYPDYGKK